MRKNGIKPKKNVWIENETKDYNYKILDSEYKKGLHTIYLNIYEGIEK